MLYIVLNYCVDIATEILPRGRMVEFFPRDIS
jgi:hypothetical protein